MLKDGTNAHIKEGSWVIPPIFDMLAAEGGIDKQMMFNTYNMGIGMMIAVDESQADAAVKAITAAGETAYIVGDIADGDKGITLM